MVFSSYGDWRTENCSRSWIHTRLLSRYLFCFRKVQLKCRLNRLCTFFFARIMQSVLLSDHVPTWLFTGDDNGEIIVWDVSGLSKVAFMFFSFLNSRQAYWLECILRRSGTSQKTIIAIANLCWRFPSWRIFTTNMAQSCAWLPAPKHFSQGTTNTWPCGTSRYFTLSRTPDEFLLFIWFFVDLHQKWKPQQLERDMAALDFHRHHHHTTAGQQAADPNPHGTMKPAPATAHSSQKVDVHSSMRQSTNDLAHSSEVSHVFQVRCITVDFLTSLYVIPITLTCQGFSRVHAYVSLLYQDGRVFASTHHEVQVWDAKVWSCSSFYHHFPFFA